MSHLLGPSLISLRIVVSSWVWLPVFPSGAQPSPLVPAQLTQGLNWNGGEPLPLEAESYTKPQLPILQMMILRGISYTSRSPGGILPVRPTAQPRATHSVWDFPSSSAPATAKVLGRSSYPTWAICSGTFASHSALRQHKLRQQQTLGNTYNVSFTFGGPQAISSFLVCGLVLNSHGSCGHWTWNFLPWCLVSQHSGGQRCTWDLFLR